MNRMTLIVLLCSSACAGFAADADPDALPPEATKAYQTYLAAVAKANAQEAARLNRSLKYLEANLRRKDAAAADRVRDLMVRVDGGCGFDDLARAAANGDLLGDGPVSVEALLGAWDYHPTGYVYGGNARFEYTFQRDGIAVITSISDNGKTTYRQHWTLEKNVFTVVEANSQGANNTSYQRTLTIKLPIPASGEPQVSIYEKSNTGQSESESTRQGTLSRKVDK